MKPSINKKQLRLELSTLENVINRYGGNISLLTAHDNIAISLDFYRGAGRRRPKKPKTQTEDWAGYSNYE